MRYNVEVVRILITQSSAEVLYELCNKCLAIAVQPEKMGKE